MKKMPLAILLLCAVAAFGHAAYFYPMLPNELASHFGTGGRADGWSTKQGFFILEAVIVVVMGISFAIPILSIKRRSPRPVNIPNAEYWFAPERFSSTTTAFITRLMYFGSATLLFLTGVNHLVFRANLGEPRNLEQTSFGLLLAAYFLFVILWIIGLFLRFRMPPGENN